MSTSLRGAHNAIRTTCINGHELPPVLPTTLREAPWYRNDRRVCAACRAIAQSNYMARLRAAYHERKEAGASI